MADPQPTKLPDTIRREAIHAVTQHALILALIYFFLVFVVPIFGEMFSGFGAKLPRATEHVIWMTNFTMKYEVLLLPLAAFMLWLDFRTFIWLYLKRGQQAALVWSVLVSILLLIWLTYSILGVASPLMRTIIR
jgi:type II secretory pathway component PulF